MATVIESISKKLKEEEDKIRSRISKRLSRAPVLSNSAHNTEPEFQQRDSDLELDEFEEDEEDLVEDHERWEEGNTIRFYLIGYVVGLSNVWRFPFLCYTYGGVAFLIPYFIFLLLFAYPFVYLEMFIGQYTQVGCIAGWKVAPLFKGVGVGMSVMAVMYCFNVQSVLAWALFYIFQAMFHNPLPWISCDNGFGKKDNGKPDNEKRWVPVEDEEERNWHTANCREFYADSGTDGQLEEDKRLPGSEYMRGRVQRMWKSGFADPGYNVDKTNGEDMFGMIEGHIYDVLDFNKDTMVCLIFTVLVVVLLIVRGLKLNTKLLIVCLIIPYINLAMLFYRGTSLFGAWYGIGELIKPRFSALSDGTTWWRAAEQVFFSTGSGLGVHMTLGSHSKPDRNILGDANFIIIVNTLTSFLSSSVVFMFLGHIKLVTNRPLESFIASGPELVFEIMADVLGLLAKANFYAIMFYTLLFFLGLTNVVTSLICAKTAFFEILPVSIKYKPKYRTAIFVGITLICFFASSVNLSRAGLHAFSYQEAFVGSYSITFCSLAFLIGTVWFWGLQDITNEAVAMGLKPPSPYFQICWKFIDPTICIVVIISLIASKNTHRLVGFDDDEIKISPALRIIGHIIAGAPFSFVIIGAIHTVTKAEGKGICKKLLISVSPTKEHEQILATGKGRRACRSHYTYLYAALPSSDSCSCCKKIRPTKITPQPHHSSLKTTTLTGDKATKKVSIQNDEGKSQSSFNDKGSGGGALAGQNQKPEAGTNVKQDEKKVEKLPVKVEKPPAKVEKPPEKVEKPPEKVEKLPVKVEKTPEIKVEKPPEKDKLPEVKVIKPPDKVDKSTENKVGFQQEAAPNNREGNTDKRKQLERDYNSKEYIDGILGLRETKPPTTKTRRRSSEQSQKMLGCVLQ